MCRDWDMWLDQPATESPKQGNTVFEIFDIFAKTKDFPKIAKTLKNLFVFDQQGLSMWTHIFHDLVKLHASHQGQPPEH